MRDEGLNTIAACSRVFAALNDVRGAVQRREQASAALDAAGNAVDAALTAQNGAGIEHDNAETALKEAQTELVRALGGREYDSTSEEFR